MSVPEIVEAASWGPDDPEVERIWILFKEAIRLIENEAVKEEADFWADRVYEKLSLARNHYIAINKPDFNKRPTSEQEGEYDALYAGLWSAYKDRLPKMTRQVGCNIEFAFASNDKFESQAAAFTKKHPEHEWLVNYIKTQRNNWHNGLRDHRNARQHDGDLRQMPKMTDINNPKLAKHLFIQVTNAIEGIGISLLSYALPPIWSVEVIDNNADIFQRRARYEILVPFQGVKSRKL